MESLREDATRYDRHLNVSATLMKDVQLASLFLNLCFNDSLLEFVEKRLKFRGKMTTLQRFPMSDFCKMPHFLNITNVNMSSRRGDVHHNKAIMSESI